jgi:putative Holliday junction resolvase
LSETILGFDVGARRIGVAVGNDLLRQAHAAAIVAVDQDDGLPAIAKLVDEWRPDRLVVGIPLPVDDEPAQAAGRPSATLARCERFAARLGDRFALPVERVDERYSSIDADDLHRDRRRAGLARRAKSLDDVAAQVILQRWFDALPAAGTAA